MVFSENRYPVFRIMPSLFRNHLGIAADPARLQRRNLDVAARRNGTR
jgi:hypothetical protein